MNLNFPVKADKTCGLLSGNEVEPDALYSGVIGRGHGDINVVNPLKYTC